MLKKLGSYSLFNDNTMSTTFEVGPGLVTQTQLFFIDFK